MATLCGQGAEPQLHTDVTDAALIARYLNHCHPHLRPRPERQGAIVELDRLNVARRHAPSFLHQTFVEWAKESWKHSAWARAFYLQQKAAGKGFFAIMRALAYKWIRILFAAWKNHTPYNEAAYIATLIKRGSPLCEYLGK